VIPILASTLLLRPPPGLVVHEWGTFTAVAGADGAPTTWHPLLGASDLPGFVYSGDDLQDGLRLPPGYRNKGDPSVVRMETPVIYLYAPEETEVQVAVDFPDGTVTEWYPRARAWTGRRIEWGTVRAVPGAEPAFPTEPGDSHYYPARATDATPLQVCDERGTELERFLFYRGVGDFPLGVGAKVQGSDVVLTPTGPMPATVLLFERRGGELGVAEVKPSGRFARPVLDDTLGDVQAAVREQLLAAGLYEREADAMIATWDGDWFAEGLRVLYVVPRAETDRRLVLTVDPKPAEVVRVLMGRLEVPTPEQEADVAALLRHDVPDGTVLAEILSRHGRFAEPLLARSTNPRAAKLLAAWPDAARAVAE
jgi:hypothetical protein